MFHIKSFYVLGMYNRVNRSYCYCLVQGYMVKVRYSLHMVCVMSGISELPVKWFCSGGKFQRQHVSLRGEGGIVKDGGGVECLQLSAQSRGTDLKKSSVLTVCVLLDSLASNTWMDCMSSLCFVDSWQTKQNYLWSKVLYLVVTCYSLRMWLALSCVNRENISQNRLEYPCSGFRCPYRSM